MFSKKKTECRVCGYRFTPERENIYTAEEPRSALEMLTAAPTRFSAVDCPICGCQIRLADRAPRIDLPAITEQHDADAEETEGGDRQDGEMRFVLHAGNGRAFTKLGSRRRGILQSALRTRDRQVGSKGFRGSAGGGYPIVLLIPARTDTAYFHDYIYGKAEIRFVRGRLRFTDDDGNAADPAPFPSMVVIYNGERVKE